MKGLIRRSPCIRERAAILKLRELGNRQHHIAKLLGRSTDFVHRTLKNAEKYGYNLDVWRRPVDFRKMPYKTRQRACFVAWDKLVRLWDKWLAWIQGEGDKPP